MTTPTSCPCGTGKPYAECCQPLHDGAPAPTPEALMRARYSAFVLHKIDFLHDSLAPKERKTFDRKGATEWATRSTWKKLEINGTEKGQPGDTEGIVEFTAHFEFNGEEVAHNERGLFAFDAKEGRWGYVKPLATTKPVTREAVPGRNDPCTCGSGKKYKKCHGMAA